LSILLLVSINCVTGPQYPKFIQFRVSGTDGAEFDYYVGDIEELYCSAGTDTVPAVFYSWLRHANGLVQGIFSPLYNDTLTIELYVDNEFIESVTITDTIKICYPPFEECEIQLENIGSIDSTYLSSIDLYLTGSCGNYDIHADAPINVHTTVTAYDTVANGTYHWRIYRNQAVCLDSGDIDINVPRHVLVECLSDTTGNAYWSINWTY
jgi:hypothetical protein